MKESQRYLQGNTGNWELVVGLEVHAQVISDAKLFSGAATAFGAPPNTQVSLVDAAMPGMLPVINRQCIYQVVRTGLALGAEVNLESVFDRKNYFYPDLPQGYQISQYAKPIVGKGEIIVDLEDGTSRRIAITRIHLEQDAGKSLHDQHPTKTFVDLNRSGVALMEIVSEPDMRSAEEAGAYVRKLRSILRHIKTCDGNMEQGSMRCDVNVSVRRPGEPYGTRCEIKNLNSVRFLMRAIQCESARQIEVIENGGRVIQETRLFDPDRVETRLMRSKEEAHDYRYFPDPDLLPVRLEAEWVAQLKAELPELPNEKRARFVQQYGLTLADAGVLVAEPDRADFFESLAEGRDPKHAANWVVGELLGKLNKTGVELFSAKISAIQLGELIDLIHDDKISGRIAKQVFDEMFETGKDAVRIVEERGLAQVSDEGELDQHIDQILNSNSDKVAEYKAGKEKLFGFFVGQVMKATNGKANPKLVNRLLRGRLSN
ncbi:MAG: Aspartyl/glutamyl-tRNA(Asn/Gln) amidotransferase subunit B [Alphaproteobacteria bacterium MarineAlpha9_Bin7]|nr:MAG: Aspartyl/glutamyl-tRNA(Asn/Gln) amidotransferase subunit B [Alphaproteobacteria bacterium MarineAlpha9_Bin7]